MFVWLCDDGPPSRGPAGFHTRSLQSLFRDVRGVVIVACEPHALFYTELPRLWRRKEVDFPRDWQRAGCGLCLRREGDAEEVEGASLLRGRP
jgi:hypothetical protein